MCSLTPTRLFVGNLPDNTNASALKIVFTPFGEVTNLDLKCKPAEENKKKFAFVTLTTSNHNVESCLKYFMNEDFHGKRLYVTRARESFLERLQRERIEAENKQEEKILEGLANNYPAINLNNNKLNPQKRKLDLNNTNENLNKKPKVKFEKNNNATFKSSPGGGLKNTSSEPNKKKQDSDMKRMESMRKKRQEFKEKKKIIQTGLIGIDNVQNKKKVFSDNEEEVSISNNWNIPNKNQMFLDNQDIFMQHKTLNEVYHNEKVKNRGNTLFDDDDSSDEVNFEIKQQFEGKKGQKVLDLQSRYKSDKRFTLDERFIEDQSEDEEKEETLVAEDENIDLGTTDEKAKQLNILQDVLGVQIKQNIRDPLNKHTKSKIGMLRFDPTQPEHAKFLAPIEVKKEPPKKSKKNKAKEKDEDSIPESSSQDNVHKVEVSKEQFYKVSDTLKEAIAQPTTFSLRSLFGDKPEQSINDESTVQEDYIPLEKPLKPKKRNPLDPGEKNPFVYDSSDSENEEKEDEISKNHLPETTEVKHIWKETLFFTESDHRLKDGLAFFNKTAVNEERKERRELKSLMRKRMYNKERKDQMFQKKIGGKRKSMRKSFRRKS